MSTKHWPGNNTKILPGTKAIKAVEAKEMVGFVFLQPPQMRSDEIELRLVKTTPADPVTGYIPGYEFDIIDVRSTGVAGYVHFRVALTERLAQFGGHIGYGVQAEFRGNRYAAKACRLLLPFIKQHGVDAILITCDPENTASARTCELLDGQLASTKLVEVEPGVARLTSSYLIAVD